MKAIIDAGVCNPFWQASWMNMGGLGAAVTWMYVVNSVIRLTRYIILYKLGLGGIENSVSQKRIMILLIIMVFSHSWQFQLNSIVTNDWLLSYSMVVLYSRDHEGLGVAQENRNHPQNSFIG